MFVKLLNIVLAESIKIPADGLSPLLEKKIRERLVFTNPDYEMRHNRGEWIGSIPPQITCIRQKGRYYHLPRGFLEQFLELCRKHNQAYRLIDKRASLPATHIEFHGELKGYQQEAAENILEKDFCTLVGGHKSGKTVIALYTIAQRKQPTLILVPRLDLVQNWLTKIESFLQIPSSEVGVFASGEHRIGSQITIAHTGEASKFWRKLTDRFGHLVLDECQRCPSKVFTHLMPNFKTLYMLGLSNSAQRKDRLSRLMFYYVGDLIYTINDKDAREGRGIIRANIVTRQTDFEYPYTSRADYSPMLKALRQDEERVTLIAQDIGQEIQAGTRPLIVISGTNGGHNKLRDELKKRGIATATLGHEGRRASRESWDDNEKEGGHELSLDPDTPVAIFATTEDLTAHAHTLKASVLVLAEPIYFKQKLAQAIHALHRNGNGEGSRLKIYDYVDSRIGLLENYFKMRSYNYGVHPDLLLNSGKN